MEEPLNSVSETWGSVTATLEEENIGGNSGTDIETSRISQAEFSSCLTQESSDEKVTEDFFEDIIHYPVVSMRAVSLDFRSSMIYCATG